MIFMKYLFISLMFLYSFFFQNIGVAQISNNTKIQVQIKNSNGIIQANASVGVRIHISQNKPDGKILYTETYGSLFLTNKEGFIEVNIGNGTPTQTSFKNVDWPDDKLFVTLETSLNGKENYQKYFIQEIVKEDLFQKDSKDATSKQLNPPINTPNGKFCLFVCDGVFQLNPCLANVVTEEVYNIKTNLASIRCNATSDGGDQISSRGVAYDTIINPKTSRNITVNGSGSGYYTAIIEDLKPSTRYFVRAYAINSIGTSYGNNINFETLNPPVEKARIQTLEISKITSKSALSGGIIYSNGGESLKSKGICISETINPSIFDKIHEHTNQKIDSFWVAIDGLNASTKYYVRAFATNSAGTSYGENIAFTTQDPPIVEPTVTTLDPLAITHNSAILGGVVTKNGGAEVTKRGVCYNTITNPTLNMGEIGPISQGNGEFKNEIINLIPNTQYYFRSFATNVIGTSYGNVVSFKTLIPPLEKAKIVTTEATEITVDKATVGGSIINDGGSPVTAKGIAYSTVSSPTIQGKTTNDGLGSEKFSTVLKELNHTTKYYYRAYATNSMGVSYGNELTFTTSELPKLPPTLSTLNASFITSNQAKSGGNITNDGGSPIIIRGIAYGIEINPTLKNNSTKDGKGVGPFTSILKDLKPSTKYYVRAYATNAIGISYGNEIRFVTDEPAPEPCEGITAFKDIQGNSYKTIQIGLQCWMQSNLKVSQYQNGDKIASNLRSFQWEVVDTGAYSIYNGITENDVLYGKLYNHYAVMDPRGLCPVGWHIPSDLEWKDLESFLGGTGIAGGAIRKEEMLPLSGGWKVPNLGATNSSEFSGKPGGLRDGFGGYFYINEGGYWWTSTLNSKGIGISRGTQYLGNNIFSADSDRSFGFSVRCLKDKKL